MKLETCSTCKEWDSSFVGKEQNIEGLCELHGGITNWDYFCESQKVKLIIKLKRLYYKIKMYFQSNRKDPVKNCSYYKNKGCVHVDGYLCPCEEMNEKESFNDK